MARKATSPVSQPGPPRLTISRNDAYSRIEKQIGAASELLSKYSNPRHDQEGYRELEDAFSRWHSFTHTLLEMIFDQKALASEFARTGHSSVMVTSFGSGPSIAQDWHDDLKRIQKKNNCLISIRDRLELYPEPQHIGTISAQVTPRDVDSTHVFIVHGHDELIKESVARLCDSLKLSPIILHEQANLGRTIIEKFEDHSAVRFAVILLTPDDKGGPANSDILNPRARQNVILELGYFLGKLGRKNVAMLYKKGVELPSDTNGLLYIEYDSAGLWRYQLAKEMRAARIAVDLNHIL